MKCIFAFGFIALVISTLSTEVSSQEDSESEKEDLKSTIIRKAKEQGLKKSDLQYLSREDLFRILRGEYNEPSGDQNENENIKKAEGESTEELRSTIIELLVGQGFNESDLQYLSRPSLLHLQRGLVHDQ